MLKKDFIKNVVYIGIILLVAVFSTYYIYFKFQNDRVTDVSSDSLDVTYHGTMANNVKITKVTPVTDSVGLSGNAYNLSIKNNLTIPVSYIVKITDDAQAIKDDECGESQIGHENLRISIKEGKKANIIYDLEELEDGILLDSQVGALENINLVVRVWVSKDTELTSGLDLHYHGKIVVIEND